jgi:hypothetical protein
MIDEIVSQVIPLDLRHPPFQVFTVEKLSPFSFGSPILGTSLHPEKETWD